ncbi:YafY family transcriptional regulator [Metabacillus sp. GX 13764]|uniref:helix-turn-helix transcriptional regulator n=1 Tax=Metabacillus kandeliae TaxID=2900151 RepID=UPI001E59AC34|nr:YafY family protein [Metabacillus kandeliae]MCD7034035.1 YafY family transcriptional regulator [Metabacillus kandeliae]
MNKSKRLFELFQYINQRSAFTAKECAEEFGVSLRTIQRDLEELSTWGVPFYSEQGRAGGYRMLNQNLLPPIRFTADEAISIYFAYESLSSYRSLPFQIDIQSALKKFYGNLPAHSKEKLDRLKHAVAIRTPHYKMIEAPLLEKITDAALSKMAAVLEYDSKKGIRNHKAVPLGIYSEAGLWYVPAYLIEKGKILLFRADRILNLKEIEPYDGDIPSLEDFLNQAEEKGDVLFDIALSKEGVRLCRSHPVFQNWLIEQEDGSGFIRGHLDSSEIPFTSALLLALGSEAKVLRPAELQAEIKEQAAAILKLYQ